MSSPPVRRALISVSDKLGLAGFARGLVSAGVEIYSTGGTRKHLEAEGIAVRDIAEYTGFPEMMDGRLKTLHPKVHGGILCRHDNPQDVEALAQHGIVTFELVVVNLYPFEATVARPGVTLDEAVEQIDIGGPTMVRAAAKNHAFTTVATDAQQYADILEQVTPAAAPRRSCAAGWLARPSPTRPPTTGSLPITLPGPRPRGLFRARSASACGARTLLRYGENPHQQAALYATSGAAGANVVAAKQLHGKELSYNNLLDLDSALAVVRGF